MLHRCRWLVLFLGISLVLHASFPKENAVGPIVDLADTQAVWRHSAGVRINDDGGSLYFRKLSGEAPVASRLLFPIREAQFVLLKMCLQAPVEGVPDSDYNSSFAGLELMLASLREQRLDFNRHFALRNAADAQRGECVEEAFPRRRGDGGAVLHLRYAGEDEGIALRSLTMTPVAETRLWFWLRWCMLGAGLLAIASVFAPYLSRGRPLRCLAVIGTMLGIIFGCCVPVGLKADLFALLAGARLGPELLSLDEQLVYPFPTAGFSLFTAMHAGLFALATLCCALLKRRVAADMLLFACTTEALQIYVPGRGPGISDVLVDATGIAAACLLITVLRRSQRIGLFLQD